MKGKQGHVPGWRSLGKIIGAGNVAKLREWLTPPAATQECDIESIVDELNAVHAVVMVGGRCLVLTENPPDPVTHRRDIALSHPADLHYLYANRQVMIGKRRLGAARVWLESARRRQYQGIVFAPDRETPDYFNLWRGFAVESREGDCSLILKHIREIIASDSAEIAEYIIAWMADAVQNPGKRPGTSIALRGGQGTGKGTFVTYFGTLFGQHFVQINSPRYLLGNFNAHLKDALLVFADEAFWAGDKTAEGILKGIITEKNLFIEFKGRDAISVKNHIRIIAASNHDWVVPAGLDERRFCVLDVSEKHKQDAAYFGAIQNERNNGGKEALLHYLLHYDLSGVDLGRIPQTRALMENKLRTADPVTRFVHAMLEAGAQFENKDVWEDTVIRGVLYDEFVRCSKREGIRYIPNSSEFGKRLAFLLPSMGKKNKRIGGDRQAWVYVFPPIARCREEFARVTGIEITSSASAARSATSVEDY